MGIAAVILGGLTAMGQRRWGALVGYAMLVDWGAGLIALGQGTHAGIERATLMLIWRALSLLLVGTGWSALYAAADKRDDIECCRGLLVRRPLSVLALLIGLLSLAGFPLTPGAAGRWPLIVDLMASQPTTAAVLILAGVGVSVGTLVSVRACLGGPENEGGPSSGSKVEALQAVVSAGLALFALWLIGFLALYPTLWLDVGRLLLGTLTFPQP
jgi:formate hydrogenlyase subunit 3/multisubunit Na+/H+ antiporter MnhD subunit